MKYERVKGHSGLIRDKASGAILNTNTEEIRAARRRKNLKMEETKRSESIISDIDNLKSDVQEIKYLLNKILEVTNGNHND